MKGANRKHSLDHIFKFIIEETTANGGRVPTYREIQDGCEIPGLSTVAYNLGKLAEQGRIIPTQDGRSRGYTIPGGRWVYEGETK